MLGISDMRGAQEMEMVVVMALTGARIGTSGKEKVAGVVLKSTCRQVFLHST